MRHLGTSFGVLRKEKCTGDPVRRLGNDLLFQQLAEENLKNLAQNKVKKIVTICPHCVRTIQEDWKEYGTPPEIEHHSEFMARFADRLLQGQALNGQGLKGQALKGQGLKGPALNGQGLKGQALKGHDFSRAATDFISTRALAPEGRSSPATAPEPASLVSGHDFSRADQAANTPGALAPASNPSQPEKIVFHDPCYLGRYRNVYDEPRAIVAQSGQLVEAPRNHERSFCCGAGGGLAFLGDESGQRVSHNRVQELIATGATTIAAACPFCNTMLNDALAATGEGAPQLVDIAQLAARNLTRG
jgi:Fe-S oxidoreductase